jgi:hypothetical protein
VAITLIIKKILIPDQTKAGEIAKKIEVFMTNMACQTLISTARLVVRGSKVKVYEDSIIFINEFTKELSY